MVSRVRKEVGELIVLGGYPCFGMHKRHSAGKSAMETVEFGPVTVAFDDDVLRPRPWTVAQSEWAAELSPVLPPGAILELGCGAGHIGLVAAVVTGRSLVQVDRSPAACAWAERNAERAGLANRVDVRCGSFADGVCPGEQFPLV